MGLDCRALGAPRASRVGAEPRRRGAPASRPVLSTASVLGARPPTLRDARTWKTMTKASRAARTAQKSLEMSYLCSDHGGSR